MARSSEPTPKVQRGRWNRGFSAMDPARRKEIAALGGKEAHRQGRAHEFTSETARLAGIKGAASRKAKREAQRQAVEKFAA